MNACDGLTPSGAFWLVVAVLRLRIPTPIRLAVNENMPLERIGERWQEAQAVAFENSPHQIETFTAMSTEATEDEL